MPLLASAEILVQRRLILRLRAGSLCGDDSRKLLPGPQRSKSAMLIQAILTAVLLLGAVFFLGRRAWRAFFSKEAAGCAKGCGACGGIDVDRLQRTIEARTGR